MDNATILETAGLRVSFHRHGDRVAHTIALVEGGRIVPLLASHEGTGDEEWPPSPPLQQVSLERVGEEPFAMLLGKAGRSHWSVSVEPDAPHRAIDISVACRLQDEPELLGSGYRTMCKPTSSEPGIAELAVDELRCQLRVETPGCALRVTAEGLRLNLDTFGPLPRTLQWRYSIRRI